nr:hypothetical protein CTI12_AA498410 [Tanacetum cinerariifolium]
MDHICNISKSFFITNFPEITTSKDLWVLCQAYGKVMDVFIPNRKSKAGKRFAFVQFIKVENLERLVAVKGSSAPLIAATLPAIVLDEECLVDREP